MSTCSCRCEATWTGKRSEHCTAKGCHQTFAGTSLGDAHRIGPHDGERRCLTVAEMENKGWRQVPCATGGLVWRGPEMSEVEKERLYGKSEQPVPTEQTIDGGQS